MGCGQRKVNTRLPDSLNSALTQTWSFNPRKERDPESTHHIHLPQPLPSPPPPSVVMDQHHSHFLHHRTTRYPPLPSHHHNHTLPPPPPLPHHQHQPLSYRTTTTTIPQPYTTTTTNNNNNPPPPPPPPPPLPPPHHQSQFPINPPTYPHRPLDEDRPNPHSFPNSPPTLFHRRNPEPSWNPSPHRNYPPALHLDREFHRRPSVLPPPPSYPPIDKIRYDPDAGNSRLRMERQGNPRDEILWGREGNFHRRVADFAAVREIDGDSKPPGGYVRDYRSEFEVEASRVGRRERWVNERKGSYRELHDFDLGATEIGDDFRVVKREYYGSELGRYNNNNNNGRGNSRECGYEFSRTPPKKQVQKKSALLRIQTPNHRNRDIEQQLRYHGGYAAESNNNFFRGKEQHGYLGHGVKGGGAREGSPVELDISFESNSLVAKAIVAPSSSAVVSDTDLSNAEKRKRVLVSEGDGDGFQPDKVSAGGLSSSPCKANDSSGSGKDLSLQKNVSDTCSRPCTSVTDNPCGKNEVAISDGNTNICSGKSSRMVVKKKKIVKRVVKKVALNPNSAVSNSPSANMTDHGSVQADSVTLSSSTTSNPDKIETCLNEKSTTVDSVSIPDCLDTIPKEGNVVPGDKKGDLSMLSLGQNSRLQECETNEDSDIGKVARFERDGNISNSPSCASSSEDKKSDFVCLDANNSFHDLLNMPNTDKVTKSLNRSTFSEINGMDYDNKQLCQNQVSLSPEKYSNVGCPQSRYLVDVGDELHCRLFSSADNVVNTDLINTSSSANDRVYDLNSSDLTGSEEKFIVTDTGNNDVVGETYFENKDHSITQYAILEENPDTAIPVTSSGMVAFSSSGKTKIQADTDFVQHASILKQGSDNGSASLEDIIPINCSGFMNNAGKQLSPCNVTIAPENCDTKEAFPNSNISVEFGEGDINKLKKRKVRTHSKILSSKKKGISLERLNSVGHANDVDTASSLTPNDPCPSEILDQSVLSLDFNSKSNLDGITALHGKNGVLEAEFYVGDNDNGDANKVSPASKRNKVTASQSNLAQCQSEFSDAIVVTTSCAEVPTSFVDNQDHQKKVGALSSMVFLSTAQSMPYSKDVAKPSDNILVGGSFESMDANRETMSSERLEMPHSDIASSYLLREDISIPKVQFSMLEGEQKENFTPIVPISNTQTDISAIGKGEKTDSQVVEENYRYRDSLQISSCADVESNYLDMKGDLIPQQNLVSCPANVDGVTTNNSNDELIEDVPDALSDMCSQGMTSEAHDTRVLDCTAIHDIENICGDEENPNNVSMIENGSDLPAFTSSLQHTKKITKSDHATSSPVLRKIIPQPSQVYSKVATPGMNSYCAELNGSKNHSGAVIPKTYQGHSFTFSKSKTQTSASSSHISKPRTWHRTSNNSPASLPEIKPLVGTIPPKRPILERKGNFPNTSYIRKGNSLVRNSTPIYPLPRVSSSQSPSLGLDELPKSTRSESSVDVTDQPAFLKTGVTNAPQQRQRTPPVSIENKSEENISSPLLEPPSSGCCENVSDPRKFIETNDALNSSEDVLDHYETPENQTGPSGNGEGQVEANDVNNSSLSTKRIMYIKPKTNQLVATSKSCDVSIAADEKGQTAFSDGYYKRSKNQLVRNTFESHINQTVAMPNTTVNSDGQGACKVLCNRRLSKRRSHKAAGNSCKPLRASLVWTLCGKNSSKKDGDSWHCQKVLPYLFPWKRTTYLRSFIHNYASSSSSSSLSAISKKLLLLRKRDTVYTRSAHGFSLWKSKVLGVRGSSLKWSKSIEKHSKKANEEATLAVAAVERKKRQQKDAVCISSQAKSRKHSFHECLSYNNAVDFVFALLKLIYALCFNYLCSLFVTLTLKVVVDCVGERIFRIGSVRYRMDPSRRTLQRISDDESLSSASTNSGLAAKRAYIPRRLVIGNDEYVRIGNGNQLVRDPKKRTRKLANEKVRWSLHTARQRLARKQKYCQFFTRFGKCNKEGGKCPYIHDPSKIAVCTKFLNGLCSTPNCKLTHKVIPERMPDCSYFLQGLCTNRNCPYRHVNVNPKASICEGFLKGYCANGNECRKKHSYVCPTFEATGTCTQGTKCKLHHPKKQSKGKKRKRSGDHNCKGRYFGSIPIDVSEPGMMVCPRKSQQNDDLEGELSDYINLDVDEEVAETVDRSFEQANLCDSDSLDLQLDNFDELIKPVLLLKTISSPQSSLSSGLQT